MKTMLELIRHWRAERRRKRLALEAKQKQELTARTRALEEFRKTHPKLEHRSHFLALESNEIIVRVMYESGGIPPARAWYAVPLDTETGVRELSFEDVAHLEKGPWR